MQPAPPRAHAEDGEGDTAWLGEARQASMSSNYSAAPTQATRALVILNIQVRRVAGSRLHIVLCVLLRECARRGAPSGAALRVWPTTVSSPFGS